MQLYADNDSLMGVLDNDDDGDDDPLTAELVDGPDHAYSFQLYGDGQFTYTPAAGFAGADSFTYKAWDGAEYSNIVAVSINVSNIAPVAVDDAVATDEDVPVIIDWASNDSDDGGDTLTIQSFTQGDHGSVTLNQDGTFTYTPDVNWSGIDGFSYTVTDGHGATDTALVTVTVNFVNETPVADDDSALTDEDTSVIITVLANDSDGDGHSLVVESVTQGANGTVTINQDGTITYQPDSNYHGSDGFTYTINDGHAGTATASVTVTIDSVNDAPSFTSGGNVTVDEDAPAYAAAWASDISAGAANEDDETLTFHVQNSNFALFLADPAIDADGTLSFTLGPNRHGSTTVSVYLRDSGGTANGGDDTSDTITFTITVNSVNDAPAARDVLSSTDSETPVTAFFDASDVDIGDTFTYSVVTPPTKGVVTNNNDGTFTFNPNGEFTSGQREDVTFTYKASDNHAADSDVKTVTIAVNSSPPVANDVSATTDEDTPVTAAFDVTDPNSGDTLSFTIVAHPDKGFVAINSDGTFTFDPDHEFDDLAVGHSTQETFTYSAADEFDATSAIKTVTITVTGVNGAPLAQDVTTRTNASTPVTASFKASDVDDGDTLTYILESQPVKGLVTNNNNGTFTFDPNGEFDAEDIEDVTFTYKARDNHDADSTVKTVTISVNNNAPVADDVSASTNEDTAIVVAFDASDPDNGDTLTYFVVTQPDKGLVINENNGAFSFHPLETFETLAVGQSEVISFTYEAADNHGAVSDIKTVTITVNGVNDAPVARDVSVKTDPATAVTEAFDASDEDYGDTLTYAVVDGPSKGIVTNNGDGTFTFDPDGDFDSLPAGESEEVSFTYKATDNHNAPSAVRAVKVMVKAAPATPRVNLTVYRPQTLHFQRTAVPEASEDTIGAGIRSNGDDDNPIDANNKGADWDDTDVVQLEDDLLEVSLAFGAELAPQGVDYFLKRSNASVKVWYSKTKFGGPILVGNDTEVQLPFGGPLRPSTQLDESRMNAIEAIGYALKSAKDLVPMYLRDLDWNASRSRCSFRRRLPAIH